MGGRTIFTIDNKTKRIYYELEKSGNCRDHVRQPQEGTQHIVEDVSSFTHTQHSKPIANITKRTRESLDDTILKDWQNARC